MLTGQQIHLAMDVPDGNAAADVLSRLRLRLTEEVDNSYDARNKQT